MTQRGYHTKWESKVETSVKLEQDLKFITPGLKFEGVFAFDTYNENIIKREKKEEETEYISKEEILAGIDAGLKDMIAGRKQSARDFLKEMRDGI